MPWKDVTVSEQRQRFLEDCRLNYYSVTGLAEHFGISRPSPPSKARNPIDGSARRRVIERDIAANIPYTI